MLEHRFIIILKNKKVPIESFFRF